MNIVFNVKFNIIKLVVTSGSGVLSCYSYLYSGLDFKVLIIKE
jgi:hypothetical protein